MRFHGERGQVFVTCFVLYFPFFFPSPPSPPPVPSSAAPDNVLRFPMTQQLSSRSTEQSRAPGPDRPSPSPTFSSTTTGCGCYLSSVRFSNSLSSPLLHPSRFLPGFVALIRLLYSPKRSPLLSPFTFRHNSSFF